MDLARLPTEVTARVVSQLPVQTLIRLALVCRAWRQLCCDDELWTSVWLLRDRVPKPRRPRGTVHAALCKAELAARWRQTLANDELLRKCYLMLCQSDCPQRIRSELSRVSAAALDINHRHSLMERNTLANLAARCGALRCLKLLATAFLAQLDIPDDGGFTPLINAAWRGDTRMVRWLLSQRVDIAAKGTSLGKGPADAAAWARLRGHDELAAIIVETRTPPTERPRTPAPALCKSDAAQ